MQSGHNHHFFVACMQCEELENENAKVRKDTNSTIFYRKSNMGNAQTKQSKLDHLADSNSVRCRHDRKVLSKEGKEENVGYRPRDPIDLNVKHPAHIQATEDSEHAVKIET
ncbi:predicted protein [Chaetoceros tenuissimus]|uniref:Uncharacterized protein n=1 Tax=Chaetoceros tenuissimus TaxID=426638 RepID=A0AAD3CLV9_9STRA|nr:predicted protein [Chaetoceros tenuissimus]